MYPEIACSSLLQQILLQNRNAHSYNYVLDTLRPRAFLRGRRYSGTLFVRSLSDCFIACPSFLETVGIKIQIRKFRDFNISCIFFSRGKSPSDGCELAANKILIWFIIIY
jgi:hypothetical protein